MVDQLLGLVGLLAPGIAGRLDRGYRKFEEGLPKLVPVSGGSTNPNWQKRTISSELTVRNEGSGAARNVLVVMKGRALTGPDACPVLHPADQHGFSFLMPILKDGEPQVGEVAIRYEEENLGKLIVTTVPLSWRRYRADVWQAGFRFKEYGHMMPRIGRKEAWRLGNR